MPKYHALKVPLVLLAVLLSRIPIFAQMPYDGIEFPDPLRALHSSFYPEVPGKPVKSVIHIEDQDTISTRHFDKAGNEVATLAPSRRPGGPLRRTLTKYEGARKTEVDVFVNARQESHATYSYDADGNLKEFKKHQFDYDKNTNTSKQRLDMHWITEYDGQKRVKAKYARDAAGTRQYSHEYHYNPANQLREIDQPQWKETFRYYKTTLFRREKIFKSDSSVYEYTDYKIGDEDRIEKISNKHSFTQYTYDSGRLKTLFYRELNALWGRTVTFHYRDGKLARADIRDESDKLNFSIPWLRFKAEYLPPMQNRDPRNTAMEFTHDKHGNVTEIRYLVEGDYKYSQRFIYAYY